MSTLRSDIEQVVVEHFDPSVMGRAQAVDDIMATIEKHNAALASRAGLSAPHDSVPGLGQIQMVIHEAPPAPVILIEGPRPPRRSGW